MSVTLPLAAPELRASTRLDRTSASGRSSLLAPLAVVCVGVFLAGLAYGRFLEVAPHLWTSPIHDRNAHYWLGLGFALDFRHADVLGFLHDMHSARVWTPLHALLVGLVLAVGELDYRLAVLPSMTAWVATGVFAFLCARRAVFRGGNLAGFAAALLVYASPAHQAFATDIMLESLGACLSLAVCYAWMIAMQERSVWSGRFLGLALTALFFQKYNYWLLVVLVLGLTTLLSSPRERLRDLGGFLARTASWTWVRTQLRHPLTYVLVPLMAFAIVAYRNGGALEITGRKLSASTLHNVVHVTFCLLVVRLWPWWRRTGRALVRGFEAPLPQVVAWHVWLVVVWFLWPQRLGYCLWYLTRDHGHEPTAEWFSGNAAYYWNCLKVDYHQSTLSLVIALVLLGVACLGWRRLRPGAAVVLCLALLAGILTVRHPSPRSRFLHSWLAAGWVGAGIGLAQLTTRVVRRPVYRPWFGGAALAGLAWIQLPGLLEGGHAPEAGPRPERPSFLELTDAYLPLLDQARRPAIFANLPIKFLTGWTLRAHRHEHLDLETEIKGFGGSPPEDQRCFEKWLRETTCDAIVLIELSPAWIYFEPVPYPDYRVIQPWVAADGRFTVAGRVDLSPNGWCATIWRRKS
jgi:hypothetical protein